MSITLLALITTPLALKAVLDPQGTYKHVQNVSRDPSLPILGAGMNLILAFIIFSNTGFSFQWSADRVSVLTWLALIPVLKAIFLLFPGALTKVAQKISERSIPVLGTLALLIALTLIYLDTRILL